MRTLFLSVLSLSINILPFLFLMMFLQKGLQQRFGARWLRLLWAVVLVRMLFPYPAMGTLITRNVFAPVLYDGSLSRHISVVFNQVAPVDWLAAIWFSVACILGIYHIRQYFRFRRYVQRWSVLPENAVYAEIAEQIKLEWKLPRSLRVMVCPGMKTPAAVGFFQPTILLPSEQYDEKTLRMVLHHEAAHLERGDILIKWCAILVFCLYWFHPAVYFMRRELELHLEFACDEAVMRKFGQAPEIQKAYSYLILTTAAGKIGSVYPFATCLQDTKVYLKKRIDHIFDSSPKKTGIPVLVFGVFLLLLSSGMLELEYYDTRSIELLPEIRYEAAVSSEEQEEQSIVTVDLYRLEEQMEEQEA